jgi:hypothetical protein
MKFTEDQIRRTDLPHDVFGLIHDLCYHHDGRDVNNYVQRAQDILRKKPGQPMLPEGCGYQGYEFGASYPDSICFGGRLYDADNCDSNGNYYEPTEHIPCPMCREKDAVDYWAGRFQELPRRQAIKSAKYLVADIRNNRKNGTEPWRAAVRP